MGEIRIVRFLYLFWFGTPSLVIQLVIFYSNNVTIYEPQKEIISYIQAISRQYPGIKVSLIDEVILYHCYHNVNIYQITEFSEIYFLWHAVLWYSILLYLAKNKILLPYGNGYDP
ncbi:hypothetical protein BDC45DRAFT_529791 [Circinella umbellata]|nr:hypothetical protein BDC45DRAFT_529791 [Circinella umbellata]